MTLQLTEVRGSRSNAGEPFEDLSPDEELEREERLVKQEAADRHRAEENGATKAALFRGFPAPLSRWMPSLNAELLTQGDSSFCVVEAAAATLSANATSRSVGEQATLIDLQELMRASCASQEEWTESSDPTTQEIIQQRRVQEQKEKVRVIAARAAEAQQRRLDAEIRREQRRVAVRNTERILAVKAAQEAAAPGVQRKLSALDAFLGELHHKESESTNKGIGASSTNDFQHSEDVQQSCDQASVGMCSADKMDTIQSPPGYTSRESMDAQTLDVRSGHTQHSRRSPQNNAQSIHSIPIVEHRCKAEGNLISKEWIRDCSKGPSADSGRFMFHEEHTQSSSHHAASLKQGTMQGWLQWSGLDAHVPVCSSTHMTASSHKTGTRGLGGSTRPKNFKWNSSVQESHQPDSHIPRIAESKVDGC